MRCRRAWCCRRACPRPRPAGGKREWSPCVGAGRRAAALLAHLVWGEPGRWGAAIAALDSAPRCGGARRDGAAAGGRAGCGTCAGARGGFGTCAGMGGRRVSPGEGRGLEWGLGAVWRGLQLHMGRDACAQHTGLVRFCVKFVGACKLVSLPATSESVGCECASGWVHRRGWEGTGLRKHWVSCRCCGGGQVGVGGQRARQAPSQGLVSCAATQAGQDARVLQALGDRSAHSMPPLVVSRVQSQRQGRPAAVGCGWWQEGCCLL